MEMKEKLENILQAKLDMLKIEIMFEDVSSLLYDTREYDSDKFKDLDELNEFTIEEIISLYKIELLKKSNLVNADEIELIKGVYDAYKQVEMTQGMMSLDAMKQHQKMDKVKYDELTMLRDKLKVILDKYGILNGIEYSINEFGNSYLAQIASKQNGEETMEKASTILVRKNKK